MATLLQANADQWPDHAKRCDDPASLAAILMPHFNLVVWTCPDRPAVPDADMLGEIDDIERTVAANRAAPALVEALDAAGYPAEMIGALARDIAAHAARLADLVDRDNVAIRLEIVETDACKKFHADYVSLRLILTYAGPGTQWLDQGDAARLHDGAAIETLCVRAIPTGDVALFKGRKWARDAPIIHRSPPIADTGQRRLVLVIDPAPNAPMP